MGRGGCGPGGWSHPGDSAPPVCTQEDRGSDRAVVETGVTLGLKQLTLESA